MIINFAEKTHIIENGKRKDFLNKTEAINYINKKYRDKFSNYFIYKQLGKKNYNIDEWVEKKKVKKERPYNLDMVKSPYMNRFLIKQPNGTKDGLCLLTALFTSFPKYFKYNKNEILRYAKEIKHYKNIDKVIEYFNDNFGTVFEKLSIKSHNFDKRVRHLIDNKTLVPIAFNTKEQGDGHVFVIVGYDTDSYYIQENGEDVVAINKLINCLIDTLQDRYNNNDKQYFIDNNLIEVYKLIKANEHYKKLKSLNKLSEKKFEKINTILNKKCVDIFKTKISKTVRFKSNSDIDKENEKLGIDINDESKTHGQFLAVKKDFLIDNAKSLYIIRLTSNISSDYSFSRLSKKRQQELIDSGRYVKIKNFLTMQ